jgi:hypothetical protein
MNIRKNKNIVRMKKFKEFVCLYEIIFNVIFYFFTEKILELEECLFLAAEQYVNS